MNIDKWSFSSRIDYGLSLILMWLLGVINIAIVAYLICQSFMGYMDVSEAASWSTLFTTLFAPMIILLGYSKKRHSKLNG